MRKFAKSIGSEGKRFGQPGGQVPVCRLQSDALLYLASVLCTPSSAVSRICGGCSPEMVPVRRQKPCGNMHHLPVAPRSAPSKSAIVTFCALLCLLRTVFVVGSAWFAQHPLRKISATPERGSRPQQIANSELLTAGNPTV